jgi:hypothetical protein
MSLRCRDKFDLVYNHVWDELNYSIQRADKENSPSLDLE